MKNFKAIYSTVKYSNLEYDFQAKNLTQAKIFAKQKFKVSVKLIQE